MCATVPYMSISLDGFIAGPNERENRVTQMHHRVEQADRGRAKAVGGA